MTDQRPAKAEAGRVAAVRSCRLCDGTGKIVLMKSWFKADGYRRERCGICSGTGQSSYICSPDYNREQRELRARYAAWERTIAAKERGDV